MEYSFSSDLKSIREILNLTQSGLASEIGTEQATISRHESRQAMPSPELLEKAYAYAFRKGIRLNRLKEMLWKEKLEKNHKLLFHGAKSQINGPISIRAGRPGTDFGHGFYTGETYDQAASFVSDFDRPSVYFLDFDLSNLNVLSYSVCQDWMITIAYYRGALLEYKDHPIVRNCIDKVHGCDFIIARIADNRMFQIIDSFINGIITDVQCNHCLAATNLGMQYVMVSDKAISNLRMIERCYVSDNEKQHYKSIRSSETKLGEDKVKLARIQFRGEGRYIDQILT